jgi:hypothetical protein
VVVKRIEGPIFNNKKAAEQHGLSCAKTGLISGLDALPTKAL